MCLLLILKNTDFCYWHPPRGWDTTVRDFSFQPCTTTLCFTVTWQLFGVLLMASLWPLQHNKFICMASHMPGSVVLQRNFQILSSYFKLAVHNRIFQAVRKLLTVSQRQNEIARNLARVVVISIVGCEAVIKLNPGCFKADFLKYLGPDKVTFNIILYDICLVLCLTLSSWWGV